MKASDCHFQFLPPGSIADAEPQPTRDCDLAIARAALTAMAARARRDRPELDAAGVLEYLVGGGDLVRCNCGGVYVRVLQP